MARSTARCAGYLAGLHSYVSPRTGLTALGERAAYAAVDEAYAALSAVEPTPLAVFERELLVTQRRRFAYGSRDVSVLDGVDVRALILNARPSFVQGSSASTPRATGRRRRRDRRRCAASSAPRSAASRSSRRSGGCSGRGLTTTTSRPPLCGPRAPRAAVLGGGGSRCPPCSRPRPDSESRSSSPPPGARGRAPVLRHRRARAPGDSASWRLRPRGPRAASRGRPRARVRHRRRRRRGRGRRAAAGARGRRLLARARGRAGAVVGVRAVGVSGVRRARRARARALPDARFYGAACARVHADDAAAAARQRLLFCVRGLSAAGADAGSIAARLQSVLDREARPLIDEPALWLRELRCL